MLRDCLNGKHASNHKGSQAATSIFLNDCPNIVYCEAHHLNRKPYPYGASNSQKCTVSGHAPGNHMYRSLGTSLKPLHPYLMHHNSCENLRRKSAYFLLNLGLHSGQYHLLLLGGDSVKPTHGKWNHSFSHYNDHVSLTGAAFGRTTKPSTYILVLTSTHFPITNIPT